MVSYAGGRRAVARRLGRGQARIGNFPTAVRRVGREDRRQGVVTVGKGDFGRETEGEVVRDQMNEVGEVRRRSGHLRW